MLWQRVDEWARLFFEYPFFLLLAPLLIFFLLFSQRKSVAGSSKNIFDLVRSTGLGYLRMIIFCWLAPALVLGGILANIIALAGPRSTEQKIESRIIYGRIAVLIDDISGSMGFGDSKLGDLKKANHAFLQEFCRKEKEGELSANWVSLVTFESDAEIRMTPTRDCDIVRRRIDSLEAKGATAIEKGLLVGLMVLLEKVDRGRVIPLSELRSVSASLKERVVLIPKRKKEFCERYKGLSILLFTDGDFPNQFSNRTAASQALQTQKGSSDYINPFNVIELAKALCIKTYFWSVGQLDSSYQEAFSTPPGTGFAFKISDLGAEKLANSYKEVARKEVGQFLVEEVRVFHSLRLYFLLIGLGGLVGGTLLAGLKNFLRHSGERA